MASIERTAFPRLGKRLSASELETHYAITDEEARLVRLATNGDSPRLTFLTLLKTPQHLGYFPALLDVLNECVRFELPRFWGAANVAIADGIQMELRENNLLGERHIRYGYSASRNSSG